MISQSTGGKSYIGGSSRDINRMANAHREIAKIRNKKSKTKATKGAKRPVR
jgi:hypothetical protein